MALNDRQRRFVEEYVIDGNATQAAIRAGYSAKTAYSIGSRLLKNVEVLKAKEQLLDDATMSAKEALYRLNQHATGNIGNFVGLEEHEIKDHPLRHLIKKIKIKTVTRVVEKHKDRPDETEEEKTIDLELYDAQSALKEILKIRRIDSGQATEATQVILKTGMDFDEL